MSDLLRWFLIAASIIFAVTGFILLVFPVDVYGEVKKSDMRDSAKGLFGQTVNSMYQIKMYGFDAESQYWWHLIWFNTAVSAIASVVLTVSLFIITGTILVITVITILAVLSVLFSD